jgi:hypothetical protein
MPAELTGKVVSSLGASSQADSDSRIRRQLAANCFRQRVELRFLDYKPAARQFSSIFQNH